MLDLLIKNASLPDGRTDMSVAVQDGRIAAVAPGLDAPAHETVDAGGYLLSPPFVDPHFHMDATRTQVILPHAHPILKPIDKKSRQAGGFPLTACQGLIRTQAVTAQPGAAE